MEDSVYLPVGILLLCASVAQVDQDPDKGTRKNMMTGEMTVEGRIHYDHA